VKLSRELVWLGGGLMTRVRGRGVHRAPGMVSDELG
jgi:hypothetical protein